MQPYLTFAMQHLELVIQIEKRALVRRGVFPSARMRKPTLCLNDQYHQLMDELIDEMQCVADEVARASEN
jgi:hypothetical protein